MFLLPRRADNFPCAPNRGYEMGRYVGLERCSIHFALVNIYNIHESIHWSVDEGKMKKEHEKLYKLL